MTDGGQFIPGKGWVTEQRESAPKQEYGDEDVLLGRPVMLNLRGEPTEFFPISSLAAALNRSVVTIRKWEKKFVEDPEGNRVRVLPQAQFGIPTKALGSRIRLYTKAQILGLRKIAEEEGLLDNLVRSVTRTDFAGKAKRLFEGLRDA